MAKACGTGRVFAVYASADDVDEDLVERVQEILGTRSVSGTFREALKFVVRNYERGEGRMAQIERELRYQSESMAKMRSMLGALLGGRRQGR